MSGVLTEQPAISVTPREVSDAADASRAKLASIFDGITDPFTVLDRDLKIVFCNNTAARLIGKTQKELVGHRIWDLIPESRDTPFHRAYEQVLSTGQPMTLEEYYQPWDRWFESSIYPLPDGLAVYTRDVTMRKHAMELTTRLARHAALRADVSVALSDERDVRKMLQRACELIVDHLDAAFARVWTLDDAGSTLLLQASAGMYTHTDGAHKAVPVGKFKIGRIAASRQPHLTNDVAHDKQIGDPAWAAREQMVAFAGYPLIVDGSVVGVLAMFSRSQLPADTMNAIGSIADLIGQGFVRRRTEIELEHKVNELARSNADLEQFAYVASHDLQEPLRMVASYNQLLARRYKGKLGDDADEFIGFTVEGVTRMQRLINDLLAYSRVGTRGGERVEVDMAKLFAMTVQNLEQSIKETGAIVTADPLPKVSADEPQMMQLLQNLIGNSIKFHGDDVPKIHVGVKALPKQYEFSVKDNGIGIDPQYFERIFVIFQRLNPREKYPGTGIGLAICKKIVERHGGRIWVESVPGQGSTVLFTIPHQQRRAS
jgi:PAS domain S-box-containing protein